jgi:hypothetical protein
MTALFGTRRKFVKLAAVSAGAAALDACSGGATVTSNQPGPSDPAASAPPVSTTTNGGTPPTPVTPSATTGTSASLSALKEFLSARASPTFDLPGAAASVPLVHWAGALTGSAAATTLANGIVVPASSALLGGPIRGEFTATLAGNPTIGGYPCLAVRRPYVCKGVSQTVGSPTILRIKTDAPVVELSGVLPDGSQSSQTLLVNGLLAAPKVLSSGRGVGGWSVGTLRLDFGTRSVRDICIETAMALAYIKIDQHDTLLSVDDVSEPQLTVVGDSYQLSRSNAFGNGGAIALELGARLGIRKVATDGVGGTGFWNSGGNVGNLNDRLPAHAADNSDIYLVMAGLNDYGDRLPNGVIAWPSPTTFAQSVSGYVQGLRAAAPNAVIVVTSPFCPVPPMSDSTYVANLGTNTSGAGDFLYMARLHKSALQAITAPWVYVDVLMGTGWLNSSGASGDATNLQWFTGGTPGPGTSATYRPGNTNGGGGGGFGGILAVPVLGGGQYSQAPDLVASGGSGSGLLVASAIDATGSLVRVTVMSPGTGYTSGAGLPEISVDPTYQLAPATLGTPVLMTGINPNGQYPLPSFAPPGSAGKLNNIYTYLMNDTVHPSPLGVSYLASRLAQNIYEAVLAL